MSQPVVFVEAEGPKIEIKSWDGRLLLTVNADTLAYAALTGANLAGATLAYADLTGASLRSANLAGATLAYADLTGADLTGANLTGADLTGARLPTGETFEQYNREVVPALLQAGGRTVDEVLATGCWECHTWQNCPMAEAFQVNDLSKIPLLFRPRAEQFILLYDARLLPKPEA